MILRVCVEFQGGWSGVPREVDVRLPGKGNSNSHGARPVHQIISVIKVDWDQEVVNKELSLLPATSPVRWLK